MRDFIKRSCVERNGRAWVYLVVMTSAKDDQFVLSNLCHPSPPIQSLKPGQEKLNQRK